MQPASCSGALPIRQGQETDLSAVAEDPSDYICLEKDQEVFLTMEGEDGWSYGYVVMEGLHFGWFPTAYATHPLKSTLPALADLPMLSMFIQEQLWQAAQQNPLNAKSW